MGCCVALQNYFMFDATKSQLTRFQNAFLHARVASQESGLAEGKAMALRVQLEQRTGDAVTDRAGLPGDTAALDLDHHVETALRTGHPERDPKVRFIDGIAEVLLERPAIDHDLTLARQEPNAGDGRLAAAGSGVERGDRHRHQAPGQASRSGAWA